MSVGLASRIGSQYQLPSSLPSSQAYGFRLGNDQRRCTAEHLRHVAGSAPAFQAELPLELGYATSLHSPSVVGSYALQPPGSNLGGGRTQVD